ncbi:hypothetical protein NXC12_PD00005 (plasmid) [Rhizobium etli]|uniref:Rap1a immunity protein domain-containing protein n=1 Tax=Rhizobium etli TaxID=29449 RepID=A0AAN1BL58_RHIET|nr:Rap1a/Tai family immunity protein [Rhizobium etli]ARQ13118.1 hypothetical protein NXC12_PD00005 [Rhizobium etli]
MRAILALSVLAFASSAQAGFYTGNDLQKFCQQSPDGIAGYIAGFIDKQTYDSDVFNTHIKRTPQDAAAYVAALRIGSNICYPGPIILQQPRDIVCRYLNNHPENRQWSAEETVRTALMEAWPCKK